MLDNKELKDYIMEQLFDLKDIRNIPMMGGYLQSQIWNETDRKFFKDGIEDPKFRLIKFHTIEATFWIEGKFRTCKYK